MRLLLGQAQLYIPSPFLSRALLLSSPPSLTPVSDRRSSQHKPHPAEPRETEKVRVESDRRNSTMAAASTLAPGVARKLKKVLETRTTDNPDVLASLATLSTFYAENTPQARRNLKSSIEQRGLSINDHFLDASLPAQMVRLNSFLPVFCVVF